MKEIIANFVVYFIEFLIAYIFFDDVFIAKSKKATIVLSGFCLYAFAAVINIVLDNITFVNTLIFVVINFAFCHICFSRSVTKSILFSIILTVIIIVSECISVFFISSLFKQNILAYKNDFTIYIIDAVTSKTLYVFVCKLVAKLKWFSNEKTNRFPIYVLIYQLCNIIVLSLFIIIATTYELTPMLNTGISVSSIFILLITIVTFILYGNTVKKDAELIEIKSELDKIETDVSYYQILEHQNTEMHTFAHNTKNHLQIIKSLADKPEVDQYIDKCFGELEKYSIAGKTNNKILDLIINKYSTICEINNIEFYVVAKTANLDYVDTNDLSAMLSNMLDNSVEAAQKSEHKKIEFILNNDGNFDVLTCINSCDKSPNSNNDVLVTTKENNRLHGFGTKSIKKIAKKYDATYSWEYDEESKEFITTIIFKKP